MNTFSYRVPIQVSVPWKQAVHVSQWTISARSNVVVEIIVDSDSQDVDVPRVDARQINASVISPVGNAIRIFARVVDVTIWTRQGSLVEMFIFNEAYRNVFY